MSTELLANHVANQWTCGSGTPTPLFDPVLGTELVRVDATGLDSANIDGISEHFPAQGDTTGHRTSRGLSCRPPHPY